MLAIPSNVSISKTGNSPQRKKDRGEEQHFHFEGTGSDFYRYVRCSRAEDVSKPDASADPNALQVPVWEGTTDDHSQYRVNQR